MSLAQLTQEQLEEMSLIDMAYVILENNSRQTLGFLEIVNQIVAATGLSETEVKAKIAQFYTDMNIDGRFLCLGDNRWGLRSWFPIEQAEEDTITQIKPKRKKAKKLKDEDDLEDFDELEDEELEYDDLDEYEEEDLLDDDFDDIDADIEEDVDEFEDEDLIEDDEEAFDEMDDEDELAEDDEEDVDLEIDDVDDEDL